jgi:hypothetical protein
MPGQPPHDEEQIDQKIVEAPDNQTGGGKHHRLARERVDPPQQLFHIDSPVVRPISLFSRSIRTSAGEAASTLREVPSNYLQSIATV